MAIATSLEREPSSSNNNSSSERSSYDVFLSFRGEDTRTNFTDHLHTALVDNGFRTFRDDDELNRGENIKLELPKAIQDSKSSVIVFSENYASSGWCLDELVVILERKKSSDHVVLPVFYKVDPSEVRKQKGEFAKAFAAHEERFKAEKNRSKRIEGLKKVQGWRAALGEVADLAGMNLQNQADRHEAKFIKKIISVIEDKIRRTPLSVTPYLIGIQSQVKKISLWLQDGSIDAGFLVIWGMSGIGKTTIAKSVYNLASEGFEGRSFLENISEISRQPNGLVQLQSQLLSNILKRKVKNHNVSEITNAIGSKRVILVLDGVDKEDQLDAILGMQYSFYAGSKIIITTTQNQLLKRREMCMVHKPKLLDSEESLELFSLHAFGQRHPDQGYKDLSKMVADYCGGLPLALQILGRSLSMKNIDVWESALEKLKDIPGNGILQRLQISYDTLQDDHDKNLFLDIVCFFIGKDKDFAVQILDECDFHTKIGISNLIDRCLITIGHENKVLVHQLLCDMGREIIYKESPKELGKRSRLWRNKDSYKVLTEKTGGKPIEGLVLHASINSNEVVVLETDAFARMCELRILILSYVQLNGCFKSFPSKLRWLSWRGFPLDSIPSDFPTKDLVVLDMHYSSLRQVWQFAKWLPLLKILNLSYSCNLIQTPDFSLLPKLERLSLKYCVSLVHVHETIGNLQGLVYLNMKSCKNIRKLPKNMYELKSLETLVISGCSNLDEFSILELCKMKSLKVFDAKGTPMNRCPNTIGQVKPMNNSLPPLLVMVKLTNCNLSDDDFPWDFSNLSSLKYLHIGKNPISKLPNCIRSLKNGLDHLSLLDCKKLQSVVELPRVNKLTLTFCDSLEKVTFQSASCIPTVAGCSGIQNLFEFEHWFKFEPITSVDVEMINLLGLCNLEFVQDINIFFIPGAGPWYDIKRLPIQGIHDYGIFNIFLPVNEVIPEWFSRKSTDSSISFTVPIPPILGLNVCCLFATDEIRKITNLVGHMLIQVCNKSKGLKWIYAPSFYGCLAGKDMIWLSHWKLGNQLEGGDEMTVSIYVAFEIQLKECGIHLVYKQDEQLSAQHNTTDPLNVGSICEYWKDYEIIPGTYFLIGGPTYDSRKKEYWQSFNEFVEQAERRRVELWCRGANSMVPLAAKKFGVKNQAGASEEPLVSINIWSERRVSNPMGATSSSSMRNNPSEVPEPTLSNCLRESPEHLLSFFKATQEIITVEKGNEPPELGLPHPQGLSKVTNQAIQSAYFLHKASWNLAKMFEQLEKVTSETDELRTEVAMLTSELSAESTRAREAEDRADDEEGRSESLEYYIAELKRQHEEELQLAETMLEEEKANVAKMEAEIYLVSDDVEEAMRGEFFRGYEDCIACIKEHCPDIDLSWLQEDGGPNRDDKEKTKNEAG